MSGYAGHGGWLSGGPPEFSSVREDAHLTVGAPEDASETVGNPGEAAKDSETPHSSRVIGRHVWRPGSLHRL